MASQGSSCSVESKRVSTGRTSEGSKKTLESAGSEQSLPPQQNILSELVETIHSLVGKPSYFYRNDGCRTKLVFCSLSAKVYLLLTCISPRAICHVPFLTGIHKANECCAMAKHLGWLSSSTMTINPISFRVHSSHTGEHVPQGATDDRCYNPQEGKRLV